MKRFLFLLFFSFTLTVFYAQNCSCKDNLQWVMQTIEQNDAGFSFFMDKTGKDVYNKLKENFLHRAEKISDKTACLRLINNYLARIRRGHIGIIFKDEGLPWEQNHNPKKIKELYASMPRYSMDKKAFEKYVNRIKDKYGPEGRWLFNGMEIGIVYDNQKNKYIGFVLNSSSPYWQPGHIILELNPQKNGNYKMVYYTRQRIKKTFPQIEIKEGKYILTGAVALKKIQPVLPANPEIEAYLTYISNPQPSLKSVSNKTSLLRIPSFSPQIKPVLDSILIELKRQVENKPFLIIDLRNNTGGFDVLYQPLLPLLYTNPIRSASVEFLSTPLNNARMEKFIKDTVWPAEVKEWAAKNLKKLRARPGEFINLEGKNVVEFKLDTILPSPIQVAVLANKRSGSSSEQFLLEAKQSKKVKVFGTPTAGSLDVSNLNWAESPCGDYILFYAISRSLRIPEMPIDGIGVQPDFYLDKEIPPYEWINYAAKILEYSGKNK